MSNILVVIGSARTGRAADNIVASVQKDLMHRDAVEVTIVDLKELNLPFFDDAHVPASDDFSPTHEAVLAWTKLVEQSDGVLFLTPEYNHSLSAIQKNAIDWIYKEWTNKPVSIIGYGWSGASQAIKTARQVFDDSQIQTAVLPTVTQLRFMKEINLDGTPLDESAVQRGIAATIDELVAAIDS